MITAVVCLNPNIDCGVSPPCGLRHNAGREIGWSLLVKQDKKTPKIMNIP